MVFEIVIDVNGKEQLRIIKASNIKKAEFMAKEKYKESFIKIRRQETHRDAFLGDYADELV